MLPVVVGPTASELAIALEVRTQIAIDAQEVAAVQRAHALIAKHLGRASGGGAL